jgi:effector-binding domain-containing protein
MTDLSKIHPPEIVSTEAIKAAVIHLDIPCDEMQTAMGPAIHEVIEVVTRQGTGPAGPVFANHARFDPERFDFEVGVPVNGEFAATGRVKAGELPAARVVRTVYRGAYEGLPDAWQEFTTWVRERNMDTAEGFREVYAKGPESSENPADWETELSWVLR